MKATVYEVDSYVYIVIPIYHNIFYGTKRIYHILTNNPTYARKQIEAIMNDGSISKGEYELNYKRNPTLENHLKPFHSIKVVESDEYQKYELLAEQFGVDLSSYYEYEYIAHYDDWDITALTNLSCINIETGDYILIMEMESMQVINIYESIVEPDIKGMETSGWPHIKELWEESNCGNFRRNSKTLQRGLKLEKQHSNYNSH